MGNFGEQITAIALAIVSVAIVAVLVSNRSNTVGVVNAAGGAFAGALATAVSPITGFTGGAATGLSLNSGGGFYNPGLTNSFH